MAAHPTRFHEPTHPGALLREDVFPALKLTAAQAARILGVSRQRLQALLAEQGTVTPDMAVRLGKLCGNGPELWLRMQQTRDLWLAERDLKDAVAAIPTMRAA